MKSKLIICTIIHLVYVEAFDEYYYSDVPNKIENADHVVALQDTAFLKENSTTCWLTLRAKELFTVMNNYDKKYEKERKNAQKYLDSKEFDNRMIKKMEYKRGIAQRERYKKREQDEPHLPAGMNLGGYSMMRMPYSVLFFHRMKLRNDTSFKILHLHNDIENFVLNANFSLYELHLKGAYDRSMTDTNPGTLIYTPSFGELEISMEDVTYSIEGRYKLITEVLNIELIVSTIETKNIWLKYVNNKKTDAIPIDRTHFEDFMMRLKTNFDKWVQDYFNDYLMRKDAFLTQVPDIKLLEEYDHHKAIQLATYMDNSLVMMNRKLRKIGGSSIRLPSFKSVTTNGMTVLIYNGTLRGLDTMYRQSLATSIVKRKGLRYVDAIIGFSDLKIAYQYIINFPTQSVLPALSGTLYFTSKELTAVLSLGLMLDPETVEIDINFIDRIGIEFVAVEGAANYFISNFKHILRHELASIMSTALFYGVRMVRKLPTCSPFEPFMLLETSTSKAVKLNDAPRSSENSD